MKNHSHRIRRAAFAAIETLEQRRLLTASVTTTTIDNGDGTVTISVQGTKNKDYITVYDDPANDFVEVFNDKNHNGNHDNGEITQIPNGGIKVILIDGKQGDDVINYELVTSYDGTRRSIEVDLGDGNDKFTFISPDGDDKYEGEVDDSGADLVDGASVNMEVEGQEKNDTIDIDLVNTSVLDSKLLVNVDAGTGNDKVFFESPFFGDMESIGGFPVDDHAVLPDEPPQAGFSEVQLQIDLGSGTNTYTQDMEVDLNESVLTVNVNGGSGADRIQDTENFLIQDDGTYDFTANLGAGNDYYNGEFDFSSFGIGVAEGSSASFNIQGGDGNDRITAEGEDEETMTWAKPAGGTVDQGDDLIDGKFTFLAYGGNGNDTIDMFSDTGHALCIPTGESGEVRVVLSGDYGNDKVLLFLGAVEDSGGDYDLSVLGAAGKDTVAAGFTDDTVHLQNAPAPIAPAIPPPLVSDITFGPAGAILVDGGRDSDQYDIEQYLAFGIFSTVPFDVRAVETFNGSLLPDLGSIF